MSVLGNRRYDPYEDMMVKVSFKLPEKGEVCNIMPLSLIDTLVEQLALQYGSKILKTLKVST